MVARERWVDDVELDLRDMDVKRRRTRALDRTEWAIVVGEYMTELKGM
jgi:hypothetical protein